MHPTEPVNVRIVRDTLAELSSRAKASARKRQNLNIHTHLEDPVNRLLNAVEPGSYVRPHRHMDRSETLLAVAGSFDLMFFDDTGRLTHREPLGGDGALLLEYSPNTWHTLIAREPGSVFFEVKQGPYKPLGPEEILAGWPAENTPLAAAAVAWLVIAQPGQSFVPRDGTAADA